MDPNEALKALKGAIDKLRTERVPDGPLAGAIVEVIGVFDALDHWLSIGGFLPDAWSRDDPEFLSESTLKEDARNQALYEEE